MNNFELLTKEELLDLLKVIYVSIETCDDATDTIKYLAELLNIDLRS